MNFSNLFQIRHKTVNDKKQLPYHYAAAFYKT
jgi:hypothetical protein